MRSLNVKIEIGLRAEDGKTTERSKNRQIERKNTKKPKDGVLQQV